MEENIETSSQSKSSSNMVMAIVLFVLVAGGIGLFLAKDSLFSKGQKNEQMVTEDAKNVMTEQAPPSGGSAAVGTGSAEVENEKTFTIEATSFAFSVKEIRVKKGDTVTVVLTNPSTMLHDFVLDEFNVKTKQLTAGQTETVTFVAEKAGTFEYYCSVGKHRANGMAGKLIVE